MSSCKVVQIKLNPDIRTRRYCQILQQEAAGVWNTTVDHFWSTLKDTGEWLKESDLKQHVKGGQFSLYSQSIQAVVEQFVANQKTALDLRKSNPDINYPYKHKRFFPVLWKSVSIKVKGRKIYLSNGKGNRRIKFNLPKSLANCSPRTAQLFWRNGCYWLSLTIKVNAQEQPVLDGVAACDMFASLTDAWRFRWAYGTTGEIHAMTITNGYDALVISGRKLREVKQYRNRRIAQLQEAISRCKRYSRRWCKLRRTKWRVQERTHRRIKDLNHKITRIAINWCLEHGIKTLIIGDLYGIADSTKDRLPRQVRQKISQWGFYTQKQYLIYKGKEVGIDVVEVDEAYTSKTCPRCGYRNRPKNRNYSCGQCGLTCHRDIVGACNILCRYIHDVLTPDERFSAPKPKYLRIPFVSKRRSSSSPDVDLVPSSDGACDWECAA